MKKTIFEGTINGEKFDSVVAYNNRMQELLGTGEQINAQSSTHTVDEDEPVAEKYKPTTEQLYPGFESGVMSKDFIKKHLVDIEQTQQEGIRHLEEVIIPALEKMSPDQVEHYIDNLDRIIKYIKGLATDNDECRAVATNSISELKKRLDSRTKALEEFQSTGIVIADQEVLYNNIREAANKRLLASTNGAQEDINDSTNEDQDGLGALERLMQIIFK